MRKIFLFSTILAVSGIASCTKDKAVDPNACNYESSEIKYNGLIKDIINTRCASDGLCHGSPQDASGNGGGEYTTYDLIKAKVDAGSFNNRLFVLGDMPQGSELSECEMEKLKAWYDAGAPE